MVMRPEPLFEAVEDILQPDIARDRQKVILVSPQGRRLTQKIARGLLGYQQIIIICGRYEGVDERVREALVDEELSIGDYILSGGEIPAMVVVDCVVRLIPGVLGDEASASRESFEEGLLDYPQYTKPANFRGLEVPSVLLSGNHKRIEEWRRSESLRKTKERRPDLVKSEEEEE